MNKLVTITSSELLKKLKSNKDITKLYPLKNFCVGYQECFDITEIDSYCLINRLLTDEDLDILTNILKDSKVEGIVFDDIGVLDVIKDMDIKKVLLLEHISNNSISVNYYLDYVDSVVVSNDLTEEEIKYIVKKAKKKVILNVFGLKSLMYSRRLLLTNYYNHYGLENTNNINAKIDDKGFLIVENNYGTKFYSDKYYNGLSLLGLDNVLFYWYDPLFLDSDKFINLLNNNDLSDIPNYPYFLDKKTIFKVGDIDA